MRFALSSLSLFITACAGGTSSSTGVAEGGVASPSASVAAAPEIPAVENFVPSAEDRFAPGGEISDEDLAKFYVSMSASVDGKDAGMMTFELWTKDAPITTRNFFRNCESGFYDGLSFHRIMREFMIQGGCPKGTGTGNSPLGMIKAEFSDEPHRAHGYGVLSMARGGHDVNSASSQFFLCCAESMSTWSLDGSYASFGKLTSGVKTLEAIANVETKMNSRGEPSVPLQKALIVKATVHEGSAPKGEEVVRPKVPLDLGGESEEVVVDSLILQWKGLARTTATRTREEADALAEEIVQKVADGEDFGKLIREYSAEPVRENDTTPGQVTLLNRGVRRIAEEREKLGLQRRFQKTIQGYRDEVTAGKLTKAEFDEKALAYQTKIQAEAEELMDRMGVPRTAVTPAFGDAAFGSEVGSMAVVEYDKVKAPLGIQIFRRVK